MKDVTYLELGGTLFVPASHKGLDAIVNEQKYSGLKSVVIDFEDGLLGRDIQNAMYQIENVLEKISELSPLVFLRARDTEHLKELLALNAISCVDGFVLAKFSLKNADTYFELLQTKEFYLMPSIEGSELFNHQELQELKEKILANKQKVLLVRFGLEDMLKQLSMRRECGESIFDLSTTSAVVGNFIATFKSVGFGVSGGVYPCFKDREGFIQDVKRDLKEGLFSKTIIHPHQIKLINELYKVSEIELLEAQEILESSQAVFAQNAKMAEPITMRAYSEVIVNRARLYGVS
jgi:citrate lyase beta subunit